MKQPIPCSLAALVLASCSTTSTATRFELVDSNGDGRLDPGEFRTAMVDGRFKQFDANQDGQVTFPEWKAVEPSANQATFDSRDANRDGVITRAEAHANARRLGTTDTLFHLIDSNGDGVIDQTEADAYARKVKTTPTRG